MVKKLNKIYVYGTLRPNENPPSWFRGNLYSLGWYPGVILPISEDAVGNYRMFAAEAILVDDDRLKELDRYEGYDERDPVNSLYIRRPFNGDGWIYEYNRPEKLDDTKLIPSGDWFIHQKKEAA